MKACPSTPRTLDIFLDSLVYPSLLRFIIILPSSYNITLSLAYIWRMGKEKGGRVGGELPEDFQLDQRGNGVDGVHLHNWKAEEHEIDFHTIGTD